MAAALVAIAAASASALASDAGPIRLGHFGSMSGSKAAWGDSTDRGARLAAEEVNAAGGLLGRRVEVVTQDDQSNPDQVIPAVLALIDRGGVDVVLGEVSSTLTLKAAPLCQRRGIPMITPSSTAAEITKTGDCVFRVCFTDAYQGRAGALFTLETLHARRVAMLVDQGSDYSLGFAKEFEALYTGLGGTIVARRTYRDGDKDFKAQLTAIAEERPDAIITPANYNDVPGIARQARALGIAAPLVGGDGWDAMELLTIGGPSVEGCYYTTHYAPDQPTARVRAFSASYQRRYNAPPPDAISALGYDAAMIAIDAIRRAGSTDHARVRDALAATTGFPGVTGTITMGPSRDPSKSVMVDVIRDNKFALYRTIEPEAILRAEGTIRSGTAAARSRLPTGRFVAQQLVNGLSLGAIYALIAVGYTVVYGVLRLINFAHGDVFMLGPAFVITIGASIGLGAIPGAALPAIATFGLAMSLCGFAGFALERVAYRPLRRPYGRATIAVATVAAPAALAGLSALMRSPESAQLCRVAAIGSGLYGVALMLNRLASRLGLGPPAHLVPLITAIGASLFLEYAAQQRALFGNRTRGFPASQVTGALGAPGPLEVGGMRVDRADLLVVAVTAALLVGLAVVVRRTRLGLAMRALSGNRDAAILMGVDVDRVISFSFALGGTLAGAAGVLWATKYTSVDALTGVMPGLKAFVAAVLGGIGSLPGAALGGLLMGVSEAILAASPASEYKDALAFLLLIVVLIVRPAGLLGRNLPEKV